jgi:indole-3-glycerol phosphate synthase
MPKCRNVEISKYRNAEIPNNMKDILQEIVAHKMKELDRMRAKKPSLRQALLQSDTGIIAEFKRKSPSKGWIKEEGRADQIPLSYQQNGAAAISILTDKDYFGGHDDFIRQARRSGVTVPILYKNFVIDEMQLYEAALCGASAVLLIAACLPKENLRTLMAKAHELGLEVLLEMHDERELEYAELEPDLCGINNRNLGSFVTDVENSFRLAERLPKEAVKVSESGISNPNTVKALRQAGFRGFLIGENFMKTPEPGAALREFMNGLSK